MVERGLESLTQLFLREQALGGRLAPRVELTVSGDVLVERYLIRAVAAPPETVPIACLVHRDPVDPCAKARLAAEPVDSAEYPEEDVLRQVERLVTVTQEVHRQLDDHPLVLGDQLGTGRLLSRRAALHERRLPAADVRPNCDPGLFH